MRKACKLNIYKEVNIFIFVFKCAHKKEENIETIKMTLSVLHLISTINI